MPDWMRPESMRRNMTVTVVTYRGLTSRKFLKTPAMSTDIVHKNAVFIRGIEMSGPLKQSIRRKLIAHRMDPESPIHDVTKIWDSSPAIELAVKVEDDFEIDDLEIWNPPLKSQEPTEVKPKKQLPGIVSGSLDGIRAQFGKETGD